MQMPRIAGVGLTNNRKDDNDPIWMEVVDNGTGFTMAGSKRKFVLQTDQSPNVWLALPANWAS
jgi:hypothetical protein